VLARSRWRGYVGVSGSGATIGVSTTN